MHNKLKHRLRMTVHIDFSDKLNRIVFYCYDYINDKINVLDICDHMNVFSAMRKMEMDYFKICPEKNLHALPYFKIAQRETEDPEEWESLRFDDIPSDKIEWTETNLEKH